jgi:hypothetical protein
MATGENAGTWGDKTNTNLEIVEKAIAGYVEKSIAGGAQTTALTITDGDSTESTSIARHAVIKLTGSITGNQVVTVPDSIEKVFIVTNGTSGAFTVQFKTVSGTGITFGVSEKTTRLVYSDGTNLVDAGFGGSLDLEGRELILDADGDTTITADTDDQIDIKIAGADDFQFTANTFTAQSGSSIVVPESGLTFGSTAITSTAAELNLLDGVSGLVQADFTKLAAIDATATEINLIDGGATVGTTAIADGDGLIINDAGTMRVSTVQTLAAYLDDEITAMPNLITTAATTVGALDSGSITSGFGTIDTGASAITTTGLISGGSLDIDNVLINGSNIGHTDDTDLLTVASGILTVAGEVSMTTLDIGGTNVTSTAAELNLVDGITAGTVSASLAVITDSNKDITGFRNVTLTGELDAATGDFSGDVDVDGTLEADAITVNGTALASVIAGTTVTNATTAAVATTVTITDNESTNENNAIIFTAGGDLDGGNLGLESDGDLKYNPSTGTLSATNISVSGTFSTVNSVTMNANNAVIFEGSTADAHETTLTSVDATGDRTISLPNVSGTLPVLAAASTTQISSTPEELNILDGVTATATELNLIDGDASTGTTAVADADGIITNDGGTMRLTTAATFKTYFQDGVTASAIAADDIAAGDAAVNVTTSSGDITVDSNAGAVSIDGHTGVTLASSNSGDITLDSVADIVLDAAGNDFKFKAGGTHVFSIINSSSDIILKPIVDGKDIIFQTRLGTEVSRIEDNGTFNIVTGKLAINGTAVSSTAAELNKLDGVGTLKQAGKETIYVPAAAMYASTTSGADAQQIETTAGRPDIKVFDFDPGSDEFTQFTIAFPKSWNEGTVTFQYFWTPSNTDTGNVAMELQAVACGDSDTVDVAYGTSAQVLDAGIGTVEDQQVSAESGAITIAGSPAVDQLCYFQLKRNADIGPDNYSGDCRLIGIKIFFTTDLANDA